MCNGVLQYPQRDTYQGETYPYCGGFRSVQGLRTRFATFRHEAFPAYKAQREETPEDIKLSVPIIKNILEAYHIPILQVDGFEADDIIGTVALKAGEKGMETYMLTPDKDYAQLVRNNVFMFRPRHGGGYEKLGVQEIEEKYSITSPLQVIDLLALMGDSADNC